MVVLLNGWVVKWIVNGELVDVWLVEWLASYWLKVEVLRHEPKCKSKTPKQNIKNNSTI